MVTSLTSIRTKPTLENHHGNLGGVQRELIVNTPISTKAWDLPMPLPQSCHGWEVRYGKQEHAMYRRYFVTPQNVFLTFRYSFQICKRMTKNQHVANQFDVDPYHLPLAAPIL